MPAEENGGVKIDARSTRVVALHIFVSGENKCGLDKLGATLQWSSQTLHDSLHFAPAQLEIERAPTDGIAVVERLLPDLQPIVHTRPTAPRNGNRR